MNKQGRKTMSEVVSKLSDLTDTDHLKEADLVDIQAVLDDAESVILGLASDEREKFDNLSEGLQASERGQAFEETADTLESIDFMIDIGVRPPESNEDDLDSWAEELAGKVQEVIDEIESVG